MTKSVTSVPSRLSQNDESITYSIKIANIFNNYFSNIAAKTKSKIKFSKKHFSNFLKTKSLDIFFIYPATKEEIYKIFSKPKQNNWSLQYSHESSKVKKDISFQLNDIFNLPVTTGIFPTRLKTAKVIPVHKKRI